jgi:hypothetical protein
MKFEKIPYERNLCVIDLGETGPTKHNLILSSDGTKVLFHSNGGMACDYNMDVNILRVNFKDLEKKVQDTVREAVKH